MFTVASNMNVVIAAELAKISRFDALQICKRQATETVAMFRKRIHQEGIASDGSQIGTYSKGYMKVRTGNYGNAGVYKRGKNAGKPKNSGVYTRGAKIGQPRPMYNRSNDTKVILSLTRQMEQDMLVMPVQNGYWVGYNNLLNFDKSRWAEKKYNKPIFSLTNEEYDKMINLAKTLTQEVMK